MEFITDSIVKGKPYPALAQHQARPYTTAWREFGQHWPHTTPAELFGHMNDHGAEYTLHTTGPGYYVIGLGFFDFDIDYFSLIQPAILNGIRDNNITVLFYYHEGDNPYNIKQRLDLLCVKHQLDTQCYRFVSGNTTANNIPGFAYFPDHELLYWRRNQTVNAAQLHINARLHTFLALSRTHKWWRATVMADMLQSHLLTNSRWSYNTNFPLGDSPADNPIEQLPGVDVADFMQHGPYQCDTLTAAQHNDHSLTVEDHYTTAYFNIVIETHFDADGSGGAFLTEKTFKPIKNAQPFVLVAPPGSLQCLRDLGYKTFDTVLDNTYDRIENNTERWRRLCGAIKESQHRLADRFATAREDIEHNQRLFLELKTARLNILLEHIDESY